MDDVELLPCPFCGSSAFASNMPASEDGDPSYIVHCRSHDAQTSPCSYPSVDRSKAEALHRWNQRVTVVDDGSLLLPCPCCGGEAGVMYIDLSSDEIRRFWGDSYDSAVSGMTGRYFVAAACKTCGLSGKPFNYADRDRSKSEAVHAWNLRVGEVLTVPTKPDLTADAPKVEPPAKPARKSNPWVVFFAVLVIIIAFASIARSLSLF